MLFCSLSPVITRGSVLDMLGGPCLGSGAGGQALFLFLWGSNV